MKNSYRKFTNAVNKIYIVAAIVVLILMLIFSVLQIASRYIPGFKLLGMEELARLMFVWVACLGASIGVSSNSHARVDMLLNHIHGKVGVVWRVILELLFAAFFLVLLYYSIIKTSDVMSRNQVTPLFKISFFYLYSAFAVSSVGVLINEVQNVLDLVWSEKSDHEGEA